MFESLVGVSEFDTTVARKTGGFGRIVKALFKKSFLIKVRHPVTIFEFLLACIIWMLIYPAWFYARKEHPGSISPSVKNTEMIPYKLFAFFAITKNSTFVLLPDCNNTRNLYKMWNTTLEQLLPMLNLTVDVTFNPTFVNTVEEMKNTIYAYTSNGYGVHWVNAMDDDALTSPVIETYRQSIGINADEDMFELLLRSIAITNGLPEASIALTQTSFQKFATPPTTELFDMSILMAIMTIFPIIISTMPDLQSLLEEKDSRVQTLSFLMGCSETAYWLVSFIMQFVLSFFPYLLMCIFLCFFFAMKGTSFTLMFTISILFIISHIWFIMMLTTFMRKASMGRLITVVLLVIAMFFGYLHFFFTLDDSNHSEAVKHVFSIIPISAYQMIIMTMYTQCRTSLAAVTWNDISVNGKLKYQVWYALFWLSLDSIIYFVLFVFFNLVNPRDFGAAPISWRELFHKDAWMRVLSRRNRRNPNGALLQKNPLLLQMNSAEKVPLLEVSSLSKTYHGRREIVALRDVSFSIEQNEVVVVIGPNGAGKSTLINILAGAVEPTDGELRLLGMPPVKRRFKEIQENVLGVCFQENVVVSLLSVKEHFDLFGAFRGIDLNELTEMMNFFAETLQLTEMLKTRAGDLSGGQKRKLCVALSLLGNPPLVIMDEPTAGVDVQSRQLIWKTIAALKHTTTIVTSHALEEAEAVSSRLFVVAGGKIPFAGTATELRSQFKCGYILRIEGDIQKIIGIAKEYDSDARISADRPDTIEMPVSRKVPQFISLIENKKEELGITSFSFSVEQLEDVLLKLIQTEEAVFCDNKM